MYTMLPATHDSFSVPLPPAAHQRAKQCSANQSNPARAKQLYLNGLAIYAVEFYSTCLGLSPNWSMSDSHDPFFRQLAPVADLQLDNIGRLECCAFLTGTEQIQVLPEAWEERIGYIAVQLDPDLQQAELLGFQSEVLSTPNPGEIFVQQLQPMAEFPQYLQSLNLQSLDLQALGQTEASPSQTMTCFKSWLQDSFTSGWEALQDSGSMLFLQPSFFSRSQPSFALRSKSVLAKRTIALGEVGDRHELELVMAITTKSDQQLRIKPHILSPQGALPQGLILSIIDEQNHTFLEVTTTVDQQTLSTPSFLGAVGEQFSLHIAWRNWMLEETFQI